MIQAFNLAKQYGDVHALHSVDLQVAQGSIYALLGPNGAGKTTTINILTTLAQPTGGSASVAGYDVVRQPEKVRQNIGVTFQDLVLDVDLSGRRVLDVHGRLYQQPADLRRRKIAELVDLVQLGDAIDRPVKTYSGGMKRRLELARGLMTDPQVLFLDEPTQGLDPQNRVAIWDYVRALSREQGLTLLLTTHFMDEAEQLADVVGIIDNGRKITEGSTATLVAELGADVIRINGSGDDSHFVEKLQVLPYVGGINHGPDRRALHIGVDNGNRRLAEVIGQAGGNGYVIEDISIARPTLGDVFLKHTGRALRD